MKYSLARLAVRGYETRNMKGIKIMGLIRAGAGALGGTLADQWKEFFYCDALPNDVLMRRGQKQITGRSSNIRVMTISSQTAPVSPLPTDSA